MTKSPMQTKRLKTPISQLSKSKDFGPSCIEGFHDQACTLLFGDEYMSFPLKLISIFSGKFQSNFGNKDFLQSNDREMLHLRHTVLLAGRMAFHFALENFIMGEMELSDFNTFFVSPPYL